MARRKIDLVMGIIEALQIDHHGVINQTQLRLQKLKNDRLRIILEQLEEGLICRHWNFSSRKYDCHNNQSRNDRYCFEHKQLMPNSADNGRS